MLGLLGWCLIFNLKCIASMGFFYYLSAFYIVQWEYSVTSEETHLVCCSSLHASQKITSTSMRETHVSAWVRVEPPLRAGFSSKNLHFLKVYSVSYLLTGILISWCNNYWLCCRDMPVLLIWQLNAKWLVY